MEIIKTFFFNKKILHKNKPTNAIISKEISHKIVKYVILGESIFELNKLMRLNKYHYQICNQPEMWDLILEKNYYHIISRIMNYKMINGKDSKQIFRELFTSNNKQENIYTYKKSEKLWSGFLAQIEEIPQFDKNERIIQKAFRLFKSGNISNKVRKNLLEKLFVRVGKEKTRGNSYEFYLKCENKFPSILDCLNKDIPRIFLGDESSLELVKQICYVVCISENSLEYFFFFFFFLNFFEFFFLNFFFPSQVDYNYLIGYYTALFYGIFRDKEQSFFAMRGKKKKKKIK